MSKRIFIHISLFILTVFTTLISGYEWTTGKVFFSSSEPILLRFKQGFPYAFSFLLFLTVHEFGHYFMSRKYGIKATLPYYIPMYIGTMSIGSMGAIIRLKEPCQTRKQFFDIGIAGPLSGIVIGIGLMIYGYATLPPESHIFLIHPEYLKYGGFPDPKEYQNIPYALALGKPLLFTIAELFLPDDAPIPPPQEIMHYPYLFTAWLALFFTALNLIPVGQLDGGHVTYGLFGFKGHYWISRATIFIMILYGGIDFMNTEQVETLWEGLLNVSFYMLLLLAILTKLYDYKKVEHWLPVLFLIVSFHVALNLFFPSIKGYPGYMMFAVIIVRFLDIRHPVAPVDEPLNSKRKILGWVALLLFILCISPQPFQIS
ncbi:MAG: site-2 protease family protein [Bacteroidia bacterium]|nr:site-2 protease family protein [Bacteroidia bacterium]MDW8302063.1 site-2 protease family protein [Bacteroidia bacterium]